MCTHVKIESHCVSSKMNGLSDETMLHIMQYCPVKDLTSMLSCNQTLRAYMRYKPLWRDIGIRDFGCDVTDEIAPATVYQSVAKCMKELRECDSIPTVSPDQDQRAQQRWRTDFELAIYSLEQIIKHVYYSQGFAAAITFATGAGNLMQSRYAYECLSDFVCKMAVLDLCETYSKQGINATAKLAVTLSNATACMYTVKKLADIVAKLINCTYVRYGSVGDVQVKQLCDRYGVRVTGLCANDTIVQSDNVLITEAFRIVYGGYTD